MKLRGYVSPERRPLKIFAFDPMFGRTAGNRITINVRNEPLWLGPSGSQVMVIDYDSANDCFYQPVNLNARSILIENGLDPSESAPRFHQQMVYAVTMKVIENFERALGRHFRFRGPEGKLRIFPHAFQDANAFYDPDHCAIFFGYFRADLANPGRNLPGQTVFTCLSHDIIAHETTHAIVDRLKPHFNDATNPDVFAFHEGFADIVAIFQHFSFPDMLRDVVQQTRTDLSTPTPMLELAQQFGHATGTGRALRTAREDAGIAIDTLYKTLWEPHDRGSILVAAVFDGFFETYQRRIRDLVRIATGGTGVLAQGDLHPDLVNRIANEASSTAQDVLTMCIRALEFLPPVDVTFGDFLRALVTADWELDPSDETGLRAATIEAFRRRGVFPHDVYSLAEESLRWPQATEFAGRVAPLPVAPVTDLLREAERTYGAFRRRPDSGDTEKGLRR